MTRTAGHCWKLDEARTELSPGNFRGRRALQHLGFGVLACRSVGASISEVSSHPVCGPLFQQAQETNTLIGGGEELRMHFSLSHHSHFTDEQTEETRERKSSAQGHQENGAKVGPISQSRVWKRTHFLCCHQATIPLDSVTTYQFCKTAEARGCVSLPTPAGGLRLLASHENDRAAGAEG